MCRYITMCHHMSFLNSALPINTIQLIIQQTCNERHTQISTDDVFLLYCGQRSSLLLDLSAETV